MLRQKTQHELKCCNCPNNATVALAAADEEAIVEVHVPAVVLAVLGTAPIPTGSKVTKDTFINSGLENIANLIVVLISTAFLRVPIQTTQLTN